MYKLLHQIENPADEICKEYNILTLEEYKSEMSQFKHILPIEKRAKMMYEHLKKLNYTMTQKYASKVYNYTYITGQKPRFLILNLKDAEKFMEELNEIPKEIAGVQLAFDENSLGGVI